MHSAVSRRRDSYIVFTCTYAVGSRANIGEAMNVLHLQDRLLISIPEVESVVGKIGRVDSPLDPAPISMIETVITYKSEYVTDKDGHQMKFRYDETKGVI